MRRRRIVCSLILAALALSALAATASGSSSGPGRSRPDPTLQAVSTPLPPASFTLSGGATVVAAAGSWLAVATRGPSCAIHVTRLPRQTKPTTVRAASLPCQVSQDSTDASIDGLWLGKTTVTAVISDSPSPHGVSYTLWVGPLPAGPLRQVAEWGWTDSDVPMGYGCAVAVAAGGGAVATVKVPNRLAVEQGLESKPACPGGATTQITLTGATSARTAVRGSWTVLATDGKQLALARLDGRGLPTGELSIVDVGGKPVGMPQVDATAAKHATDGWLTPDGLILRTSTGISGPTWSIRGAGAATVAYGRLLYVQGKELRVLRLKDGVDRPLRTLPGGDKLVAAGAFGLAVTIDTRKGTSVYRLAWRVIDATLPAK